MAIRCIGTDDITELKDALSGMLDRVEVDYYDVPTPLKSLGSITVSGSNQLVISLYDQSCIGDVEKALSLSDLGMMPNSDGKVIRLNVPQLTEERRKELRRLHGDRLGAAGGLANR